MLFGDAQVEQIQKTEEVTEPEAIPTAEPEVIEEVPEPQQNVKCEEEEDDDIEVVELIEQPVLKKEQEPVPATKREPSIEMENLEVEKPKSVERASKQVVIDKIEMKPEVVTPFDIKQED